MARFRAALVAAATLLILVPARAQTAPTLANVVNACGTPNGGAYTPGQNRPITQDSNGNNCVNASVSVTASITGFTPNGSYSAPLAATTASSNVALPTGTVIAVSNDGPNTAYVNLGTSNLVTATTASVAVPPNATVGMTVGSNTFLAAITATGTATVKIAGGAGLVTGYGAGSGGGSSSNGSVSNTGAAVPSQATYGGMNVGGNLTGFTGTANGLKVDGSAVTQPVSGTVTANQGTGLSQTSANAWPTLTPDSAATTGTITTSQSVTLTPSAGGYGSFGFQISGTWTGLIILEGTVDGTNWFPTTAVPLNSSAVGAFTANNAGQGSLAGLKAIRLRGNTVTSGTATVTLMASQAPSAIMQDNLHWSTNVDQINGNTVLAGAGATGTGSQRVTVATDSSTVAGSASLPAGTNTIGGVNIVNGANTAAVKAASTAPTTSDPALVAAISPNQFGQASAANSFPVTLPNNQIICGNVIAINQTASTDLHTFTNKGHICSIVLVTATAQSVSLVEGTGTTCATGTAALIGGTSASMALATNGGFSAISGIPWLNTQTTADHLCLLQSGSANISGTITYTDQP